MNELKVFTNEEFGSVRTVEVNGEPWLVGKDVADALGYANSRKALADHVDAEDRKDGVTIRDAIGRDQSATVINESGVYSLVFSSKLPGAKRFKHWVTSEVLPSIRKHGMYMTDDVMKAFLADPRNIGKMLIAMADKDDKIAKLESEKKVLLPDASYAADVLSTHDTVTVTTIADDYGWSANRMNRFLHEKGIQYPQDDRWVLYTEHKGKGYTENETVTYRGKEKLHSKTFMKWTQKGRRFIYDLMKENGYEIKPGCEFARYIQNFKEEE